MLYVLIKTCILKLQQIQNSAAKIIYQRNKFAHLTPLLKQLHWLQIRQRIEHKLLLLCFKAQHGLAPSYLQDCIIPYFPCCPLRTKHLLVVPSTKLKHMVIDNLMKLPPYFGIIYRITYEAVTNLINLSDT